MEKIYFIRCKEKLVPVSEMVYRTYYKMKRREKYLVESDLVHGKTNFQALDTNEYLGEEIIPDKNEYVEEKVLTKILIEKLLTCLPLLTTDEYFIIYELFYNGKSEVELSKETGIPRTTIQSKKYKILAKLKKLMKV